MLGFWGYPMKNHRGTSRCLALGIGQRCLASEAQGVAAWCVFFQFSRAHIPRSSFFGIEIWESSWNWKIRNAPFYANEALGWRFTVDVYSLNSWNFNEYFEWVLFYPIYEMMVISIHKRSVMLVKGWTKLPSWHVKRIEQVFVCLLSMFSWIGLFI